MEFRRLEEALVGEALAGDEPAVVALGGGAVVSEATWSGSRGGRPPCCSRSTSTRRGKRARASDCPLARDEARFASSSRSARSLYARSADAAGQDAEDVLLAALGITVEHGALGNLAGLLEGGWPLALVADERVLELHRAELGERMESHTRSRPAKRPSGSTSSGGSGTSSGSGGTG